ncbi:uncharacterized protein KRP23_15241 [Phytophthora ramorum]|uniref:uncharacterized protein n=1 Tax=Phytophthora ramorum TaxID=164328 RepID=UPI00309C59F0|nr:hypothetical protein KRP23_15241 [Phytophthora ramorum]
MAICPNVTNCRFLRLGCRDEQHELFSPSYVRSNKKRSAKLFRCFPHCCPDHKQRSYCQRHLPPAVPREYDFVRAQQHD